MSQIELSDNLTLFVKGGAVQLSPAQSFKLAQKLVRGATRQIVRSEAAEAANDTDARARAASPGAA